MLANPRKRPQCTKCGMLMAGHRRRGGTVLCPTPSLSPDPEDRMWSHSPSVPSASLPSPPASPHGSRGPSPGFQLPEGNRWHWRNPNWMSPARKPLGRTPSDEHSLVPTEPLTETNGSSEKENLPVHRMNPQIGYDGEGSPPYYAGDGERSPSPQLYESPLDDVLGNSIPLAAVFSSPRAEVPLIRQVARREGVHIGFAQAPSHDEMGRAVPELDGHHSCWVVVGSDEFAVKHILDLQRSKMPGMLVTKEEAWAPVGFFHLAFAGVVGGLVVIFGLFLL
ncbi:hypothetical protein SERLA73DRAFT_79916 [Serpula lacrymans var. lacrymans S7.3]|uniref:Uncharacterized protein n=2 Tax=Serpula lacrymans var. lacrymans TaxID=341189 RepID=F8QI19_SERL3|nr:uncharacterized protein SERLADRAFT_435753 [Serpula lacrymans var. lacrymans S7.9]EGN92030.1 hypothetical protein SERLA73DRAFT_79916 [Serpula lacrymans var. lacrymans S7.3]EGO27979.1 hypothetical protein SERLADRAFT_435753 [Serpula lacrymans var. lacrymans S7.9]